MFAEDADKLAAYAQIIFFPVLLLLRIARASVAVKLQKVDFKITEGSKSNCTLVFTVPTRLNSTFKATLLVKIIGDIFIRPLK